MTVDLYKLLICSLIFFGIIFLIFSIKKFRSNIELMREFYIDDSLNKSQSLRFHQALLFLFLFGYSMVLTLYVFNIKFVSDLITSLIFFFGSVFVFIENNLHKSIVSSIKKNYDKTLKITSALEEEREKLLSLNKKLAQTEDVTIFALAYQAELRDGITGNHIARTSKYVQLLTEELMKKHCEFGADIIRRAMQKLKFRSFLQIAEQLTLSHHEKWDGTGYPRGLKGEDIPLSGRIMALADVYDALRTKRQYKEPFSHKRSCEIIFKGSGTHFDPDIIASFSNIADQFEKISIELANEMTRSAT